MSEPLYQWSANSFMNEHRDRIIESCEENIESDKKVIRSFIGWNIFNISILVFDWQSAWQTNSLLMAFGFGAMVVTCIWSLGFTLVKWGEIKDERRRLFLWQELKARHEASDELSYYVHAKNQYDRLIAQLKEKENDRPSEPPTPL